MVVNFQVSCHHGNLSYLSFIVSAPSTSSVPSSITVDDDLPSSSSRSSESHLLRVTSKPESATRNYSSASSTTIKPPVKLKQASLTTFLKPQLFPLSAAGKMMRHTDVSSLMAESSSSKYPQTLSPSKILSNSPTKRTPGRMRSTFMGTKPTAKIVGGMPRGSALSTLSRALEKLHVPPPSRPNTSLGLSSTPGENSDVDDDSDRVRSTSQQSSVSTTARKATSFARPTASSLRRAATLGGGKRMGGLSSVAPSMQKHIGSRPGVGNVTITARGRGKVGLFGRAGQRASKYPTLPTVEGSPVKAEMAWIGRASGLDFPNREEDDGEKGASQTEVLEQERGLEHQEKTQNFLHETVGRSRTVWQDSRITQAYAVPSIKTSLFHREGQPAVLSSTSSLTLNPASAALHALSQSLTTLSDTPSTTKPKLVGTRRGLRSSSMSVPKASFADDTSRSANSSPRDGEGNGTIATESSSTDVNGIAANDSGGAKKSSLRVLKKCAIFVDVRTEQGDDAGALFVDMLRGLGAKVGQQLLHQISSLSISWCKPDRHYMTRSWEG